MVLEKIDELIDVCAPDSDCNALCKYLIGKYKEGNKIVRKKENYIEEDLANF